MQLFIPIADYCMSSHFVYFPGCVRNGNHSCCLLISSDDISAQVCCIFQGNQNWMVQEALNILSGHPLPATIETKNE